MNTVPVWVNLLNPVRRLADSADCNQHRARLCANGGFWRKADLRPNLHVAEGATSQIGLLLNSDLANSAPDGMFPTVLMRGHDG
jgi:hypothetical protein